MSPVLFSLYANDMPAMREWRIAINISKSAAMLFANPVRRISKPRPVHSLGSRSTGSIPPVIFGWPLKHGISGRFISIKWKGSSTDSRNVRTSPRPEKWSLHQEWSPAVQASHCSLTDYACLMWRSAAYSYVSGIRTCFGPSVFSLLTMQIVTLVTSKRFDSKLAELGSPLVTQLGRYLRWPSVDPGPIK